MAIDLQTIKRLPPLGVAFRVPFVDQPEWGHPAPYADLTRWPSYDPVLHVPHYGGGGPYRITNRWQLFKLLRDWRIQHIKKGWPDLAYNAAAWYPLIRTRGLNHNGANRDSSFWGGNTFTVVWAIGPGEIPHRKMIKGWSLMWAENPGPVIDHGRLPTSPSGVDQNTRCAGEWLRPWIDREGWFDYLARNVLRVGRVNARVRSLKRRLRTLGYWNGGDGPTFTPRLSEAIKEFQRARGLKVTGKFRLRDWRELSK